MLLHRPIKASQCIYGWAKLELIGDVISDHISSHVDNVKRRCTHVLKNLFGNGCLAIRHGWSRQIHGIVRKELNGIRFLLDLTCDVIGEPKVNEINFASIFPTGLLNVV